MSVLFRIRTGEKEAAAKEIESWRAAHNGARPAWEVEDLLEEALAERDRDEAFLKRVLERARGADREKIEEAHRFIQDYCRNSIRIHDLIRESIRRLEQAGHPIDKAAELDQATRDYQKWQDDYPELLLMAYEPVGEIIARRIAQALADRSEGSDWRRLFDEDDQAAPAE
jgi:hypothetical protein